MKVSKIRIKHATIYGFGKWVDDSFDFSAEPFLCVYGENESGKTTLHKFILFMLFGLPPKQRKFYYPKTSSKMGGRLTISDAEVGEYTIERLDGKNNGAAICHLFDGKEADEDWLQKRLKDMTVDIYQSIFSFSALDLNHVKEMKDEDLGEILLGIGFTGATNLHMIEKRLESKMGKLFKPSGKIPVINEQLETLDSLFVERADYQNNESTYRNKKNQVATLMDEIAQMQTQLEKEREARLYTEKIISYLPVIHDYHDRVNQLASYPNKIQFPEKGIERIYTLKEKMLPMQSELSVLKSNQEKNKEQYRKLQKELVEPMVYAEAEKILQQREAHSKNKQALLQQEEIIHKLDFQINTKIEELNIDLMRNEIKHMSFPFHIEKIWSELKNNIEQFQLEKEQSQQEHQMLQNKQSFLLKQFQDVKSRLLTEEYANELHLKLDVHKEHDYLKKKRNEAIQQQKKWETTKRQKEKGILHFLIGSTILSLLIAGAAFLSDTPLLYNLTGIIFIIGLFQWAWGKKSIKETRLLLENDNVDLTGRDQITEQEKQEMEKLLIRHDENRSILSSIKEQQKSNELQLLQWQEKWSMLKHREERLNEQKATQYKIYPFLREIAITFWPELYHAIKQLVGMYEEEIVVKEQSKKTKEKIMAYETVLKEFFAQVDQDVANHPIDYLLKKIERIIDKQKERKRLLEHTEKVIAENNGRQRDIKQKVKVYEKEMEKLFSFAHAHSENEFYKVAKKQEEKQTLEKDLKQIIAKLQLTFSHSTWENVVEQKTDQNKLKIKQQDSIKRSKKIESKLNIKRQHLATLSAELKNMESSNSYSNLLYKFEMEKEQLTKFAHDWAVLKVAKEMLEVTKRNYRDKYMTRIMNRTSDYFKQITANAYINVIEPMEDKPFQIESVDHIKYNVNELSQGTIDQLYICLRLAMSEIMSEEHRLPFIIDDAFVHFDALRMKRIMEILTEISKKRQVILFTCKQEIVDLLSNTKVLSREICSH